jgi:DNA-binding NtrC family response regulator
MSTKTSNNFDAKKDLRILIAENDESIRDFLCERISSWGYQFRIVENGQPIESAESFAPNVLIIDLDLQEESPASALHELRARGIEAATIVTAADSNLDNIVATLEPGTYDFLPKPINPLHLQVLLSRLETQLSHKGARFELRIGESLEELEREFIIKTLDFTNGNKVRAAQILGISLKTLYNRLARYRGKQERPATDEPSANPDN